MDTVYHCENVILLARDDSWDDLMSLGSRGGESAVFGVSRVFFGIRRSRHGVQLIVYCVQIICLKALGLFHPLCCSGSGAILGANIILLKHLLVAEE